MDENIILYSTNCPKCRVLEKKLEEKGITHEIVSDVDVMIKKGFMTLPMLEVNGDVMNFAEANNWILKGEEY